MIRVPRYRWSTVLLVAVTMAWVYPVIWTLGNAFKTTADLYQGAARHPDATGGRQPRRGVGPGQPRRSPPQLHLGRRAQRRRRSRRGRIAAAFALTRLHPPARAALFVLILAPLIIPTEVLIVPLFSIYRTLGLINSLPGLALVNVVFSVSFATVILGGYFRRIPQDVIDAARLDGAGRLTLLRSCAIPLARPGIMAVGLLVALFAWNDFSGALVLIQRPDSFTAPLALTTFSTFYATDEGLRFAGLAITFLPPLIVFLLLQRTFVQGLTVGTAH